MLGRRSQRSLSSLTHHQRRQMASQPRRLRPSNWKGVAPAPLSGSLTFAAQSKLPQLPVPELRDTLSRLKESLKPIAWSESEYASVAKKIDAFERGKGPELQERLLQRASTRQHWLEEWWDDAAYLGYRDSVCIFATSELHLD